MLLYSDAIEYLVDYLGGGADNRMQSYIRRAVAEAYRNLAEHPRGWKYYVRRGRVNLNGSYSTGTVTYTAATRTFVISGGAWPSWASQGEIEVDGKDYKVRSVSGTSLVVSEDGYPVSDITDPATFVLSQTQYPLPSDFADLHIVEGSTGGYNAGYVTPEQWFSLKMQDRSTGEPYFWTVMGDTNANSYGNRVLCVYPTPDNDMPHEFLMRRQPRPIRYSGFGAAETSGTISISGTTVTGVSTSFSARMVGSVLRLTDGSQSPTGLGGLEPYTEEVVITGRSSATSLTIASAPTLTYSGAKYRISDPIDIDDCMIDALHRGSVMQIEYIRNATEAALARATAAYRESLIRAWESDNVRGIDRAGIPMHSPIVAENITLRNYRVV